MKPNLHRCRLGNRTAYAYDRYGNLSAVTNPLGNAVVYEYDLRGRKIYEGGATYPVRYTYDVFGNKTTMTTYRNESLGPASGDVTTWRYDEASNCMTNKVYADGKGPKYGYTPDGRLSQRIWARGIVTDYSYDGWGSLTNTVYSDGTPTVTLFYDAMGRQTNAVDAAGVTTFAYDDSGSLTNETVIGAAGENTIIRHWDSFGRTAGYTLNNVRQTTIGYDAATGRIATMLANGSNVPFTWSYLPGSDLKSSLAYPNGLVASWQYDANGQLVQTSNAFSANVISQYNYVYDAAGSRISCLKTGSAFAQSGRCVYEYNARSELINAFSDVDDDYCYSYGFDGIGNRNAIAESGTNSVYMANQLNQYVLIDDFVPVFDDDGNQTFIRTYTGSWAVIFNGENRPASWCSGETNVIMSFDRMGRRVSNNGSNFSYDGYVQIADSDRNLYIWDRTDTVATRPLVWRHGGETYYYSFDDKNVSEVFDMRGNVVAHYEYAPFGHSTRTDGELAFDNKFRYSSEYSDDELDLIYYNYRHYDPHSGRWCARDPLLELASANLYTFCANNFSGIDVLGRYQLLDFLNDVEYSFGRKLSMVEEVVENALDNVYNNVNLVLELIVDGSYRLGKRTAESTIEASKVLWKLVSNTAAQLNKKLDDKFGFCGSGFTAVIVPNKFPGMRASFSARGLTVVFAFTVVDFNKCCKDHDNCYKKARHPRFARECK